MRCKIKNPYLNENLQTKKKIEKDEKFKKIVRKIITVLAYKKCTFKTYDNV